MPLPGSSARRAAIVAAAAAATLVAGSPVAESARPVAASTVVGSALAGTRFNVAAPHSPKLERMLAGKVPSVSAASTAGLVKGIDISSHQHDGGAAIGWAQVALGKCLAGPAGSSAAGTPRIWTCGRSAGQQWTLAMNGTIRLAGKCLAAIDVTAGHAAPTMRACTGRTAQLWRPTTAGGLANALNGFALCLADPGASHVNGTTLELASCDGSAGQAWTLPAGPLVPGQPGRCLTAHPAGAASPASVSLARCVATARQAWRLAPGGSITAAHLCLDAAQPATPGEPVTVAACRTGAAQRWRPIPGAAGQTGTLIVNPSSGLCMATTARHAAGSPLVLGYCDSSNPRQAWRIS